MSSFFRIAVWLAIAALPCGEPVAAQSEQNWQRCIGSATAPALRVTACSAVIDANVETGERLASAHCSRGLGLTELDHFDTARADFNEATRIAPSHACAYNNRGRTYALMREFDRAVADYDKAIGLQQSFGLAYNNRGHIFYRMQDTAYAIDFRKALEIRPDLLTSREARPKPVAKLQ
jgi:tetratricopeptide (TPR) repeat protein